jgi:hypothetical protein
MYFFCINSHFLKGTQTEGVICAGGGLYPTIWMVAVYGTASLLLLLLLLLPSG